MGFVTVQAALIATFTTPAIPGLSKIYGAEPIVSRPGGGRPTPGKRSDAFAWVDIGNATEIRESSPTGGGGLKQVTHAVTMGITTVNSSPQNEADVPGLAVADHLGVLDAIVARLRAQWLLGTTAGTAGQLWAAEAGVRANDGILRVRTRRPSTTELAASKETRVRSDLAFNVIEFVQS